MNDKLRTGYFFLALTLLVFMLMSCAGIIPKGSDGKLTTLPAIGICHAGTPGSAEENAVLDELGIEWVRNDFRWSNIEPSSGEWDWTWSDTVVAENNARGRKMLCVLGFDTEWLHANGGKTDAISAIELPRYIQYVEKVVTRYNGMNGHGKVEAWEIWNEPNLHRFWKGTDAEFFSLSKAAARKIRDCDPNAKIVAGSFCMVPTQFITKMFASGALADVDAISFHPYAVNPAGVAASYDNFTSVMKKMNYTGEIWVTEIGYPTAGIYPSRVCENNLGSYISDTVTALALRGANTIIWYHLKDDHTKNNKPVSLDSEKFFGLVYKDYEKKPGVVSFTKLLDNITAK